MHVKKAFKSAKIPLWLLCDAYEWPKVDLKNHGC